MDGIIDSIIDLLFSGKTHFPLGRMNIDVQVISFHFHPKRDKREFMLHQKSFVSILDRLCDDVVFDITAIDIIIFKWSGFRGQSPVYRRIR